MLLHVSPEIVNSKRSQVGCGSGTTSALTQRIFNNALTGRMADGALAARPYMYLYIFYPFTIAGRTGLWKHVRLDTGDSYPSRHLLVAGRMDHAYVLEQNNMVVRGGMK